MTFYNLLPYFSFNLCLWLASITVVCTFTFIFASRLTFGISVASIIFFGSPLQTLLRGFLPKTRPTRVPLEDVVFSSEEAQTLNQRLPIKFVWFALSSPQLRSFDVDSLSKALPDAILINLTPSIFDFDYLVEKYPHITDRLCQGSIPVISYQVPLVVRTKNIPYM